MQKRVFEYIKSNDEPEQFGIVCFFLVDALKDFYDENLFKSKRLCAWHNFREDKTARDLTP